MKPLTINCHGLVGGDGHQLRLPAADLDRISWAAAAAGFCTNAAIVRMYSIFAQAFPTHVRAFGTVRDRCWPWRLGVGADPGRLPVRFRATVCRPWPRSLSVAALLPQACSAVEAEAGHDGNRPGAQYDDDDGGASTPA